MEIPYVLFEGNHHSQLPVHAVKEVLRQECTGARFVDVAATDAESLDASVGSPLVASLRTSDGRVMMNFVDALAEKQPSAVFILTASPETQQHDGQQPMVIQMEQQRSTDE